VKSIFNQNLCIGGKKGKKKGKKKKTPPATPTKVEGFWMLF